MKNNSIGQQKIFITTPIFYPNSVPHLGTCHTVILADFLTRGFRFYGHEVAFLTGLDEHGSKVLKSAGETDILEFLGTRRQIFQSLFQRLLITYDKFICTETEEHKQLVLSHWQQLKDKNLLYRGTYTGYYCLSEETYFKEEELVDGKSPSGKPVEWIEEQCYFLRSNFFAEPLRNFLSNNNLTVPNNRINELQSFIKEEVKDLCVARSRGWGIKTDDGYIIYVWFDALLNYLTQVNNISWANSHTIQLLGKDIVTFHGIHWLIILMALGLKTPDKLLVHNWWTFEGEKMSKSIGNVVDPISILNRYNNPNLLRFFCVFHNLIGHDGVFSEDIMLSTYNDFLVDKFSNLVHRLASLLWQKGLYLELANLPVQEFYQPEQDLKNQFYNLDITAWINRLFQWCNDLNSRFEAQEAWKNLEAAKTLFLETKKLISYFQIICPDVSLNTQQPTMLFTKIPSTIS